MPVLQHMKILNEPYGDISTMKISMHSVFLNPSSDLSVYYTSVVLVLCLGMIPKHGCLTLPETCLTSVLSPLYETLNYIDLCVTLYSPGGAAAVIMQNCLHALEVNALMNGGR